jgi:hypothetical protein
MLSNSMNCNLICRYYIAYYSNLNEKTSETTCEKTGSKIFFLKVVEEKK